MGTKDHPGLPSHYPPAIRTLLRYAIAMAFVGLLSGVLFQESAKKLPYADATPGLHLEATIHLALLHGHVFLTAVVLPLTLAFSLVVARRIGGAPVGTRSLSFLTRGYLPFLTLSLALMLYKGYHVLLAVRGGATDLGAVSGDLFGGQAAVRHAVYGVVHTAMAVSLGVFLVGMWRSLAKGRMETGA